VLEVPGIVEALEHLEQRLVDDDRAVLGIVDDEADLIAVQPRVERVQHSAHGGYREVQLHVLGLVPHERGHRVPLLDPQAGER
jgi:hypothetical protein